MIDGSLVFVIKITISAIFSTCTYGSQLLNHDTNSLLFVLVDVDRTPYAAGTLGSLLSPPRLITHFRVMLITRTKC